jgi:hypothetical protein
MKLKLLSVIVVLILLGSAYIIAISAEDNSEAANKKAAIELKTGTWVKYHIKRNQKSEAAFKTIWESDLKISIIEEKKQKNEKIYEVELVAWSESVNKGSDNADNKTILKLFVNSAGEPILEKMVIKHPNLSPLEIDLNIWAEKSGLSKEVLFKEITGSLLIVPFTTPSGIQPKPEKVALNIKDKTEKIDCQRYVIEGAQNQLPTKIWFSTQLPFPRVAKMMIFEDPKGSFGSFQTQIAIVEYDTKGAVTLVKDRPIKLNFKEKK